MNKPPHRVVVLALALALALDGVYPFELGIPDRVFGGMRLVRARQAPIRRWGS
jgi:hypothetical protein